MVTVCAYPIFSNCMLLAALDNSLIIIQRIKERNGMHLKTKAFQFDILGQHVIRSMTIIMLKCFRKNNEDSM